MYINESLIHRILINEINNNVRFNPTKPHVFQIFEEINNSFFNGSLPVCNIQMYRGKQYKDYLGFFNHQGRNPKNGQLISPTIWINGMYQMTMDELKNIVAHEMIHYYLAYNGKDIDCKHTKEFKSLASQMNSTLGLHITDTIDISQMDYGNTNQQTQISNTLIYYMQSYSNSLKSYLPKIQQEGNASSGNIAQFYTHLYKFTQALIQAIDRCVQKKSLNEESVRQITQKLVPFKPINDFINGYEEYYNKAQSWLDRERYKKKMKDYDEDDDSSNNIQNSQLMMLLTNEYAKIKQEYQPLSRQLKSVTITNEFKAIDELKKRINNELRQNTR